MKLVSLIVLLLLGAAPVLAEDAAGKPSTDPNPDVRIEGDTLIYIGGINANGLQTLNDKVRTLPRGQVTKMIVNSGGGDTKAGIFIGSIIADLKPHLSIETGCFSSCTNSSRPLLPASPFANAPFWDGMAMTGALPLLQPKKA